MGRKIWSYNFERKNRSEFQRELWPKPFCNFCTHGLAPSTLRCASSSRWLLCTAELGGQSAF